MEVSDVQKLKTLTTSDDTNDSHEPTCKTSQTDRQTDRHMWKHNLFGKGNNKSNHFQHIQNFTTVI